jgi:hypothetical protein
MGRLFVGVVAETGPGTSDCQDTGHDRGDRRTRDRREESTTTGPVGPVVAHASSLDCAAAPAKVRPRLRLCRRYPEAVTTQMDWIESGTTGVRYPSAPWQMVGQLYCSVFKLEERVDDLRPGGIYGAAFVSYEEGSPLTYSELLVARPVSTDKNGRRVTITDIWVDSPASVAGGRELWAIPKDLCDFTLESEHRGPFTSTEWSAREGRTPIAAATFRDVSRAAPRVPFKGGTWQPGIEDTGGEERTATLQGSSKTLPARARWDINPDGPLGWLAGARQLASFRQAAFRMSFG